MFRNIQPPYNLERGQKLLLLSMSVVSASYILSGFKASLVLILIILDLVATRFMTQAQISFIGLEFATVATILAGFWFGPVTGSLTGGGLVLLRSLTSGLIGPFLLWKLPGFIILGALSGILTGSLYADGILLATGMRAIFIGFTYLMMRSKLIEDVIFSGTNIYLVDFILNKITSIGLI